MRTKIFASLIICIALILTGGCTGATPTPTALPTTPPATSTPTALPTNPPATPTPTPTPIPTTTPLPTNPPGSVTLQYFGISCTLIYAEDGTRIISDPYGADRPSGLALFPNNLAADAVTVSHFHPDHSNTSAVKGKPKIISEPGTYQVGMVKITGYKSDHGLIMGNPSGPNTVFVFEIGNIKIVHLGAAGVVTQSDILAAMENADVIIVDIMGDAAHPLQDEMNQLLERKVRTIIPGHYSFDANHLYYGSVTLDEFLKIVPSDLTVVKQGSIIHITADMPKQMVVLAPAANENH